MSQTTDVRGAATACGCPEDGYHAGGTTRRSLLRAGLLAGALGTTMTVAGPDTFSRYAFADDAAAYAGDTLVVLSLRGGFDGLGAVAPVGDPQWAARRPTIGLTTATTTRLDAVFGMSRALDALVPLWNAGTFGVVHDVGQDSPTRSHFEAMSEMERAAPGGGVRSGWIDRTLGARDRGTTFQGTQVGSNQVSPGLAGPFAEMSMSRLDDTRLSGLSEPYRSRFSDALRAMHAGAPATLAAPTATALDSVGTLAPLQAADVPENGAVYPTGQDGRLTPLARSLRDVVRLVRGGVGLQVATVDWGDWDMHVGAGGVGRTDGWMHGKLSELARAMAAFATDLGPLLGRTTLVTLSEFGRRVSENGSGGTDHGHGNLVMLLGGGVVGGRVHGTWRGLDASVLSQGDLAGTTDYRQVLGEILQKRCGAGALTSVFPGLGGAGIGVVRAG